MLVKIGDTEYLLTAWGITLFGELKRLEKILMEDGMPEDAFMSFWAGLGAIVKKYGVPCETCGLTEREIKDVKRTGRKHTPSDPVKDIVF